MQNYLKPFSLCCVLSHIRGRRGKHRGTKRDLWLLCRNARQFMARDPTISDPLTWGLPGAWLMLTLSTALGRHPEPAAAVGAPHLSPRGRLTLGVSRRPQKPAQTEIVPLETWMFC